MSWWNPVDDVKSAISATENLTVSAAEGVVHFTGTVIHDGVKLTEDLVNDALGAVRSALHEVETLLSLLGNSGALVSAASDLEHIASELGSGAQGFSGLSHDAASTGWTGAGATSFVAAAGVHQQRLSTGSASCDSAAAALRSYASAIDSARGQIESAKNTLDNTNILDFAAVPSRVVNLVSTAQSAADGLKPAASSAADTVIGAAMRAPEVTAGPGASADLTKAWDNNKAAFEANPLKYLEQYKVAEGTGFLDGAKSFAVGVWNLGEGSFEYQWGSILGIKSWQQNGSKTLSALGTSIWHLSAPYWLFRFATDPLGAQQQGQQMLSHAIDWKQIQAGQANVAVGHIEGELGFQAALIVGTAGIGDALSSLGGVADLADGADGIADLPAGVNPDVLLRPAYESKLTVVVGNTPDDQALAATTKLVTPEANGVDDVALHGSPTGFAVQTSAGQWQDVSVQQLAKVIRSGDWNGGPIRLISCDTGSLPDGAAQQLANELHTTITAPTKVVTPYPNGQLVVGTPQDPGTWVTFTPKG